ncbi:MAG: heat-inducible transcriptional repressor HrcA [candidate division KSB1 bacterium]|nr:heat-inducible transcriptional repressor HrcA [candidate division KSB1 bacterium]
MDKIELTARENQVFMSLMDGFISSAEPVGSRYLSKHYGLKISAATVRNVMADLEMKGLISQPHTSAGRVPTTFGYRKYVESIEQTLLLSEEKKQAIFERLQRFAQDMDHITARAADVLSDVSWQLGIVLAPRFHKGVLNRIELVPISHQKVLLILNIQSGLIKTVMVEIENNISSSFLTELTQVINERIHGLTVSEFINSFNDIFSDFDEKQRVILEAIKGRTRKLVDLDTEAGFHLSGARHMFSYPEFGTPEKMEKMLELLDRKDVLVRVLNTRSVHQEDGVSIVIGDENAEELMRNCSLITTTYEIDGIQGKLGILGPTRMQYAKIISLVKFMAETMTFVINQSNQ